MTKYMRYTYGLESYSEFLQAIRVGFFTRTGNGFSQQLKAINYLCKKPHLRCLAGFLICVWVSKLKGKVFFFFFSNYLLSESTFERLCWQNPMSKWRCKYSISDFEIYTIVFDFYLILDWNIFLAISVSNSYFEDNFCALLCEKYIFLKELLFT